MAGRPKRIGTIDGIPYGEPDEFGTCRTFIPLENYCRCRLCGKSWDSSFQRKSRLKCPNCDNNKKGDMSIGEERW